MNFIRRRTSNKSNVKNPGIRRRTNNNSYYYRNFVSASSRFNNDNTKTSTNRSNRIRECFTDILNIELQQKEQERNAYHTYHVQNEENMIQGNDNDNISKL